MRDAGRIAAAIEVLADIEQRHRPVRLALKSWGEASRYAGAKDRAWVSGLVLDALRRKRSLGWMMGGEAPRLIIIAVLHFIWGWPIPRIVEAFAEAQHGPGDIIDAEAKALAAPRALAEAPAPVRGDYPDWLDPYFDRQFGDERASDIAALATRAPVDLRVNSLKTDVARTLKALGSLGAAPAGILTAALRVPPPSAAERAAPVEAAPEFQKGWFEVQDLGSQIAAATAGDIKGRQVLDLCAGGGGKTLALAAAMQNTGQLYAYDSDARRLSETVKRATRAGVRNLQVRSPFRLDVLADLTGCMDLVFVDAPCTGSGTWRRHPDAKWRLTPQQLEHRIAEQDAILSNAAGFVKPGGRLVYVTCSLLAEENEDRLATFLTANPAFSIDAIELAGVDAWVTPEGFLRLTPRSAATDGFFVGALKRRDRDAA